MPLSVREQEVVGMMTRGLRNKEIARPLFITDCSVQVRAEAVDRKFHVANRTGTVSVELRRGMVALDLPVSSASHAE